MYRLSIAALSTLAMKMLPIAKIATILRLNSLVFQLNKLASVNNKYSHLQLFTNLLIISLFLIYPFAVYSLAM